MGCSQIRTSNELNESPNNTRTYRKVLLVSKVQANGVASIPAILRNAGEVVYEVNNENEIVVRANKMT